MTRHIIILILLFPLISIAQLSEGGFPASFDLKEDIGSFNNIELQVPYINVNSEQGLQDNPQPFRIGEPIVAEIDLIKEGTWSEGKRGERILRLGIGSKDARGLVLYYSNFSIPEGGRLFIYSLDESQLIGAFTHKNNPSGTYFATEMIQGDELVLEYNSPKNLSQDPIIKIHQVHYIYEDVYNELKGSSGPCEVNVNCPEGGNWQNEKRSVAKILLTSSSGSSLCTGALINNMKQDSTPYFLTARHCGSSATPTHFSQWLFYFNFESPDCEDPIQDPPSKTITGCELVAEAPDGPSSGSDFRLLKLNNKPPADINPWFAGWRNDGLASPSGVCIHHPKGDIKKISTYTASLVSCDYGSSGQNPNGNYWRVVWVETESGHGVTEGGSSGSAIFDNTGKLVGTLTGGAASCTNLNEPDFYGKFSEHWDGNGSDESSWLKPWLDPENTGVQSMEGFGYGSLLSANFAADTTVISIGGRASFEDLSLGDPEQWEWTFYGGSPGQYSGQNPSGITYAEYGEYGVRLKVTEGNISDELFKDKYIRVTPNLYPNPAYDHIVLDFGSRPLSFIEASIYDMNGRLVQDFSSNEITNGIWRIQLGSIRAGRYIMRVKTDIMEDNLPLVVY